MIELCIENISSILEGKEPKTLVNKDWRPLVKG